MILTYLISLGKSGVVPLDIHTFLNKTPTQYPYKTYLHNVTITWRLRHTKNKRNERQGKINKLRGKSQQWHNYEYKLNAYNMYTLSDSYRISLDLKTSTSIFTKQMYYVTCCLIQDWLQLPIHQRLLNIKVMQIEIKYHYILKFEKTNPHD